MRRILRRFSPLLPAVAALVCLLVCRLFPAVAERVFARGVFRALAALIGRLTQYVPFSLAECLAVAALPLAVGVIVWAVRRRAWRRLLRVLAWVLSWALLLYMLMHGLQYHRRPLAEQMDMQTQASGSVERLAALTAFFAEQASAARLFCEEDEAGCMRLTAPLTDTLKSGGAGYAVLEEQYPFLRGTVIRTKGVKLSHWWSYTGITGMYFPFLAEANINVDAPDTALPVTITHELAHTRGYAHEDECNFLGILAAVNHPDPAWQYAGWLEAYMYTADALFAADVEAFLSTRALCSEGMLRDLACRATYWKAFDGGVQEMSNQVNDTFIRVNGDAEGVARYDQVTALLLSYYGESV